MTEKHFCSHLTMSMRFKQRGMALLMLAFALGLIATTIIIKSINSNSIRIEQDKKTIMVLKDAKAALIAWSINHPSWPGLMPYPDRNNDPNGYDGASDCPGGVTTYTHLIGRLPWKTADYDDCTTLLTGLGSEFKDGGNEPLWYAVSRNIVHSYSPVNDPTINPGIIDTPTYPWMTVLDKNGNIISNRVAVVILAPGAPVGSQDRSSGIAGPSEYLDNFHIGAAIFSNTGYTIPDEDFVMGEDMRNVPSTDTTYQHPYEFNDKLVYITIDELLAEIENRAAGEVRYALAIYKNNNSYFPYAAPLGSTTAYSCEDNNLRGKLPVTPSGGPVSCSCSSGTSCSCSFSSIASVSYKRSGASTWSATNISGLCTRPSSQTCSCTGAGFCKNTTGSRDFTCDGLGNCTSNTTGTYTFSGAFTTATVTTSTGGCSYNCSSNSVSCTGSAGNFSSPTCGTPELTGLPTWVTSNKWQDYFYYEISSSCTTANYANCSTASPQLTVGGQSTVQALLVSTSKPITSSPFSAKGSAQSRPSCATNDYLDSSENTNGDQVYDARNTTRTSSYNDKMFILSP